MKVKNIMLKKTLILTVIWLSGTSFGMEDTTECTMEFTDDKKCHYMCDHRITIMNNYTLWPEHKKGQYQSLENPYHVLNCHLSCARKIKLDDSSNMILKSSADMKDINTIRQKIILFFNKHKLEYDKLKHNHDNGPYLWDSSKEKWYLNSGGKVCSRCQVIQALNFEVQKFWVWLELPSFEKNITDCDTLAELEDYYNKKCDGFLKVHKILASRISPSCSVNLERMSETNPSCKICKAFDEAEFTYYLYEKAYKAAARERSRKLDEEARKDAEEEEENNPLPYGPNGRYGRSNFRFMINFPVFPF